MQYLCFKVETDC